MRVTVYASSSPSTPAVHLSAAAELGRLVAERGWTLVNGAGRTGCMGALNDSCLAAGGTVEGVILRKFQQMGLGHEGLQDMLVVDSMRERKRLLAEGSEAYLVLAGGPGTWEELWEIAVERQIGQTEAPLILINTGCYYQGFLLQLQKAAEDGFLYGPSEDLLRVVADPSEALDLLEA